MLLANGNLFFINGPKSLRKNLADHPILYKSVFDNFRLSEKLFTKALQSLKACVLVNNNLQGKLFSSLHSSAAFGEIFKVTS